MKRKTSAIPSRIWTFGLPTPAREAQDEIHQLLRDAHKYYNSRVEIERDRRAKAKKLSKVIDKKERAHWDTEFKNRIADACSRSGYVLMASGRYAPRAISAVKGQVLDLMLSDPDVPDVWKSLAVLDDEASRNVKEVRKASGLPPGTYLLVDKAFESACRPPKNSVRKKKSPKPRTYPVFKRWDGSGRIGAQVRRESVEDVFSGSSNALRLLPRGEDLCGGGKRRPDRMEVQLRTGPGSKTLRLACVIHRRPPEGAVVTGAWIRVYRIGPRVKYELQLVLESQSFERKPVNKPAVAIDLGWRKSKDGKVRAGYWADESGREGEISVPSAVLQGLEHCSSLDSIRDRHHNKALFLARKWVASVRQLLPDEIQSWTSVIHAWKSPSRLARLAGMIVNLHDLRDDTMTAWQLWKSYRLGRGLDLFASYTTIRKWANSNGIQVHPMILFLDFWRRKNKHLYLWSESRRRKVLLRRDSVYRNEAARIASEYGTVVFENFDLRGFARDALPDEDPEPDRHHRVRNVAAPGRLRQLIVSAVGKDHVVDEEMANSTRECHVCGFINSAWDRPWILIQSCGGCGSSWDQDRNAAIVLLKRHCERRNNGGPPVTSRRPTRPRRKVVEATSTV